MSRKSLKSMLSVGLSLLMMLSLIAPVAMALEPGDTEENPIYIKSRLDLETFAQEVNDGESFEGKYIKLSNDIFLTANETLDGKPVSWTPIGYCYFNQSNGRFSENSKSFNGTFDGNGYSIFCNIGKFDKNDEIDNGSLFGHVGESGVLKNTVIRGMISGEKIESGVAALCDVNEGLIENCKIRATIAGVYGAAGISTINCGTIKNCEINGKILSKDLHCAGVCAINYGEIDDCKVSALIANCIDSGIKGDNDYKSPNTGGVVSLNRGKIANCIVDSYISNKNIEKLKKYKDHLKQKSEGKKTYIGCAGGIASKNNGIIEHCEYLGSIKSYEVGGIVGINYETTRDCVAQCNVFGAIAGGIAAQNIEGDKCYAGECVSNTKGGHIDSCRSNVRIKTLFLAGEIVCTKYWEDIHAIVENCNSNSEIIYIQSVAKKTNS